LSVRTLKFNGIQLKKEPEKGHYEEDSWRAVLTGRAPGLSRHRRLFKLLPREPRCKFCNAPFQGIGSAYMKMLGRTPYAKNPRFCNHCLVDTQTVGVEIEISMLFADVRGSTPLAERLGAYEFGRMMNRFYATARAILIKSGGFLHKLVGDEVVALYIPGFSGPNHARLAIQAAQELLAATGYGDSQRPWPIGIGVHTGMTYVGLVGTDGDVCDLEALGDSMNIAARLASAAAAGEALISETSASAAGLDMQGLEGRSLELKGKSGPVEVRVMRRDSTQEWRS